MSKKNYFRILGIDRGSGSDEVKRAYRKLALRYHPDKAGCGQEATKTFLEIREAYDVLSDIESRTRHERELDSVSIPIRRSPLPRKNYVNNKPGNLWAPTRFPFFEAFEFLLTSREAHYGTERNVRIDTPYKTVTITVEIPPGIDDCSLLEVVGPRTRRLGVRVFLRARIVG